MNLRYIICTLQLLCITAIFAQKEYKHKGLYASLGYETGFLSIKTKDIKAFENIKVKTSLSHTGNISAIYKTPFRAEIKLGYALSYNIIPFEGVTDSRNFKIESNYYSHSIFLGAGYNISVKEDIDIKIGLGSSLSYVKNENIYEEKGSENDKLIANNNSITNGNAFIIPEIAITNYFNNEISATLGVKYQYSTSNDFLNGSIQHIVNNSIKKQIDYKTKNNCFLIYLRYQFKFL